MNIELRTASLEDGPFLRRLHRDAMEPHVVAARGRWDPAEQAEHFQKAPIPEHQIIVVDRRDVGCLLICEEAGALVLSRIWIAPLEQGRGIGSRVILQLCERARVEGVHVRLRVLKVNRARYLYARLGFVVAAETATHLALERAP